MNEAYRNQLSESRPLVYDVVVAEEARTGKTYWHTVGVAFPLTTGSNGLSLKLHMFPGLRVIVKESLRPIGASRQVQTEATGEDVPF